MSRSNVKDLLDKDTDYIFQYCEWLFKPLGLWWSISDRHEKIYKLLSFVIIFTYTTIILFTVIPGTIYIVSNEPDLSKKIVLSGPIIFSLSNCIKYYIIIFKIKVASQCFQHIKDDLKLASSENSRLKIYKYFKLGRHFMFFLIIVMYSGGIAYDTILPFYLKINPMIRNETRRPHAYYGYDSIFDSQATPIYEIVFFIHLVNSMIGCTIVAATCSLAAIFASHICGQVNILNELLYGLVSDTYQISKKSIDSQIAVIIKRHMRILRFAELIEQMLREICLVEVLASTLAICLLEYYFLLEWSKSETIVLVTYILLLISLSSNIFILCYIGEILQEQCVSIGQSTYMIDWYKLNGKSGLSLMLIIAMANYPLKITAGGLMNLNIRSFGSIIKTTVVYLNMLRTVTN